MYVLIFSYKPKTCKMYLLLFGSYSFWIDVIMGMKVASTDPRVLERDDRAVGQLLRTTGVV